MNASAKFPVFLDAAHPTLLIDSDKHLLGEAIEDDGSIVDSLLLNAKVCADPRTDMLDAAAFAAAAVTREDARASARSAGASRSGPRAAFR